MMTVVLWIALVWAVVLTAVALYIVWRSRDLLRMWWQMRRGRLDIGDALVDVGDLPEPLPSEDELPQDDFTPAQVRDFDRRITALTKAFHRFDFDEAELRSRWIDILDSFNHRPLTAAEMKHVDAGIAALVKQRAHVERLPGGRRMAKKVIRTGKVK